MAPIALVAHLAFSTQAATGQGVVRLEFDPASEILEVLNSSSCAFSASAMTADVTVSPKSKFRSKKESPSEAIVGSFWFWGMDAWQDNAQLFEMPGQHVNPNVLPSGYRADAFDFGRVAVFSGETPLHLDAPDFSHLPGAPSKTKNRIANVLAEDWNWGAMEPHAVSGDWHIDGVAAELKVEGCPK